MGSNTTTQAEDKGVTICMELLNSKVNHRDYMFDHIAWGVDVMKRVNSPRVKILFDIYHAQIMDGDIVRNIRDHFQWIAHFHTGGNPGRHEIDDTQELNYRFVAQAIADLGYTGVEGIAIVPFRTPPGGRLHDSQTAFNKELSGIRAAAERAVASVKTWRMLSEEGGRYRAPISKYTEMLAAVTGLFFFSKYYDPYE